MFSWSYADKIAAEVEEKSPKLWSKNSYKNNDSQWSKMVKSENF